MAMKLICDRCAREEVYDLAKGTNFQMIRPMCLTVNSTQYARDLCENCREALDNHVRLFFDKRLSGQSSSAESR